MKKFIIALLMVAVLVGCDADKWERVETGSKQAGEYAQTGQKVAVLTAPFTAGYGSVVGEALAGISIIALAISSFAKTKKANALAKASSEAADNTQGGGKALIAAALKHGVVEEVRKVYEAKKG